MKRLQTLVLLLALPIFALSAINVPLEVSNWADIAQSGEPISGGIPLPAQAVYDLGKLRITDGSGNTVPCQFRALTKWWWEKHKNGTANPSAKWVLCDFQPASVSAKGKTAFYMKDDNTSGAPSTSLAITEDASGITVVTGPLKFTVSKTLGNLFDGVWMDANTNGQFESGEQIVASSSQNGGFITAGDWTAEGCVSGTEHSTNQQAPERVVIDEQGPMKVVLRVEGRHYAPANGVAKGLYGYRILYTAYAGKPYVDVQYAVTNNYVEFRGAATLEVPGYTVYVWPFRKYEIRLNLTLGASQSYTLLGASEVTGSLTASPAVLHQGKTSFSVTGGAAGPAALGGATVSDGNLGLMWTMRDFAPNNPKEVRLSNNSLVIGLFPDSTLNYHIDNSALKNHRMRFSFVKGAIASGALTDLYKKTDAPLRLLATDRAWYRNTNAWYRGYGIPPDAGFNRLSPSSWTRLSKGTGQTWKYFGYIGGFNSGGDHENLTSMFWGYTLTGNPADFESSEEKAFYFNDFIHVHFGSKRFEDYAFYTSPEDHLQAFSLAPHPNIESQLYQWVAYPGYVPNFAEEMPGDGHMSQLQEIEYYQLTGDPATLESLKDHGVMAALVIWYRTYGLYSGWLYADHNGALADLDKFRVIPYGARYVARPMIVAMHAYEVTGDDRYFRPMQLYGYSLRNYARKHPLGYISEPMNSASYIGGASSTWTANHPGVSPPATFCESDFQLGIANEALYGYWRATGDESMRDALIISGKAFEWRAGISNGKYTGFTYAGWGDFLCDGKRYSDVGITPSFGSSASEAFSGLIFSYLASGRADLWPVINDGQAIFPNYYPGGNTFEMKIINMFEAKWRHDSTDIIPPAAITDLSAVPGPGSVRLTWTAPGNDGNTGTAAEYQIKYAKAPIVDFVSRWSAASQTGWPDLRDPLPMDYGALWAKADNYQATREISFWNACNTAGESAPRVAGTAETFQLTGLGQDSLYYFALVSYDNWGNVSGLSNITTASPTAIDGARLQTPNAFALCGNIPNPFNPTTVIRYYVPGNKAAVRLALFDVKGSLIRELEQGIFPAGMRQKVWNGQDMNDRPVGSGIYLLRLSSGKDVKQSRIFLVK
jgi:hypothetical protein